MKVVVGLGNPGKKYEGTRHNIGFDCIQRLADKLGVQRFQGKYDAEVTETVVGQEKLILMRPMTFMNLSGKSVKQLVEFFQLPLSDLLIICDDLALPPGKIRLRAHGSSGGQKGLKHICDLLDSLDVPRLRIGIGPAPEHWDPADYVLAKFSKEEKELFRGAVELASGAVMAWVQNGIAYAMSRFNGDSQDQDR